MLFSFLFKIIKEYLLVMLLVLNCFCCIYNYCVVLIHFLKDVRHLNSELCPVNWKFDVTESYFRVRFYLRSKH
jgi:hypothetical protein